MFYSHQILARKTSLGQIWMAATMHAKMNRRKLNRLNLVKICEEILNPSVPMALRLSGILMGGVVIVYERKVKLLLDDVNRLVVELNQAWKVKAPSDPTLLPKGKSEAKKEAVTLPERHEKDIEDIEPSLNPPTMRFQHTAYATVTLDDIDVTSFQNDSREEEQIQDLHQADVENITLFDRNDSYQANVNMYNLYERFDIEEDDETQRDPAMHIPSPPREDEPVQADENRSQCPEVQVGENSQQSKDPDQEPKRQVPPKRRRRAATFSMDYEQTMIPGHQYQSWLQDALDICSRRSRKKRTNTGLLSKMKIAKLMELPPTVLLDKTFQKDQEICYPAPLMELWKNPSPTPHTSRSARTFMPQHPQPSISSPTERQQYSRSSAPFEDMDNLRPNFDDSEPVMDNLGMDGLGADGADPVVTRSTPRNSGDDETMLSSGSGQGNLQYQKRPSSSRKSSGSLEPVAEEFPWQPPNFELSRLSENGPAPDPDLLETGVTQTQHPSMDTPGDKITESIRVQLKTHFDAPGGPKVESLDKLADGLNRRKAARLFYQTCVLATLDSIRVEQHDPFGDILISRGPNM